MLKREFFKGVVMGMILTIILTTFIFASPIEKTISVVFNNIKLYVNGSLIIPKDSEGNIVEPMIYNGTAYLPAKAVSEAVGLPVTWDGKTNSIYMGKIDKNSPSIYLDEMDYLSTRLENENKWRKWEEGKDKDNTGKTYEHGIAYFINDRYSGGFDPYGGEFEQGTEYLINMKYNRFKGTLVRHYNYRNIDVDNPVIFTIYGDGKLIYTSPKMTRARLPVDFDLDVTGVIKLQIMIESVEDERGPDECEFGIVNAGLYD